MSAHVAMLVPAGRIFSDWLGWLTSDWDNDGNRARFEATLSLVDKEMGAAGVSHQQSGSQVSGFRVEMRKQGTLCGHAKNGGQ